MNPTWPAVDNWLDLIGNVWIGMVVILAGAVPSWLAARNHRSIRDIKDQVVNGHAPEQNLRDDLDKAISAINDLGHELRGLRSDLLAEGQHRRAQISDIQDELDHIGKHRRQL